MAVLYSFVAFVAFILILAMFIKKNFGLVKEIIIAKPKDVVFEYLKSLKKQDNFSVWGSLDPNMKKSYKGDDGTVGFVSAWESTHKNVGSGEQEIIKIAECERIDFELRFLKPMKATNYAFFTTESVSNRQTLVKWGFNGKMNYPMNLMLLIMNMEKMIGKDFETGLSTLKTLLEQQDDH